ncbi:unnamed protein product [Cylicostephanus goldi]|uniref:Uncharacterized protein n=1 Tax=Cylicostephanus goldi TaxID=71465 RepID=A0A3P7NBM2_CYLGO|nr:unnamed protein product [Cylicostephanus goldi]
MKDPESELSKLRISPQRMQLHIHLCEPRLRASAGCKFKNPFIAPAIELVEELPRFKNPFIAPAIELVEELPRLRANLDMTLRDSPIAVLDGGPPGVDLKLHNSDELHQLPISQMGNYEEYIKGLAAVGKGPLRPVEPTPVRTHAFGNPFKTDKKTVGKGPLRPVEPTPVRTHAFGNPFKTDKKSLAIDEVGEGMVGANAAVPTAKETRRERKADGIGRPPKRKPGPVAPNCLQQWRFGENILNIILLVLMIFVVFHNFLEKDGEQ